MQFLIVHSENMVTVDNAYLYVDCSALPANVEMVAYHEYAGKLDYNDRPAVRTRFTDPSPYQLIINNWLTAAAAQSPPLQLSQAKQIKVDYVEAIYQHKRRLPFQYLTHLYDASDEAIAAMMALSIAGVEGEDPTSGLIAAINTAFATLTGQINTAQTTDAGNLNSIIANVNSTVVGGVNGTLVAGINANIVNGVNTNIVGGVNTNIVNVVNANIVALTNSNIVAGVNGIVDGINALVSILNTDINVLNSNVTITNNNSSYINAHIADSKYNWGSIGVVSANGSVGGMRILIGGATGTQGAGSLPIYAGPGPTYTPMSNMAGLANVTGVGYIGGIAGIPTGISGIAGVSNIAAISVSYAAATIAGVSVSWGGGTTAGNVLWQPLDQAAPIPIPGAEFNAALGAYVSRRNALNTNRTSKISAINALGSIAAVIAYDVTAGWSF